MPIFAFVFGCLLITGIIGGTHALTTHLVESKRVGRCGGGMHQPPPLMNS
ncbi:hypothetical protein [Bartonella sp. F02]|nr:hypothetical protein [Bartonella sp. F02]MCZ2328683.1 hypothetical protein [Bartonella sp. F02]